jgi:hypothetical protein
LTQEWRGLQQVLPFYSLSVRLLKHTAVSGRGVDEK